MVRVSSSYDGVHNTELVDGPKWYTFSPQSSLIVTGGSSFFGSGPTSYFQRTLLVRGSRAATKPRPVQHWCRGFAATACSYPPPATITLPSARIGAAKM